MSFTEQELAEYLADPKVCGVLENIEGGQLNLLSSSALEQDLRVEFPMWHNSEPSVDFPEYVELFWNDTSIELKTFTVHPVPPADLFINVPIAYLQEGEQSLVYYVTSSNGSTSDSLPYTITIDKTAPILKAGDGNKLVFPSDVLPPKQISIDYLATPVNNDQVRATVPVYTTAAPGDVVIATWKNPSNDASQELRSEPLTHLNYTNPIELTFTGDFIRAMGDGPRAVTYRIEDRASNPSADATPVDLDVAAIRPPRFAPNPWVLEIDDDPSDWGPLDPMKALNGVTVRIPEEAVYFRDDRVEVQFGEPGTVGALTVPVAWGTKEVRIPPSNVAPYLNKTMVVYYVIYLPEAPSKTSGILEVAVREYPRVRFSPPQLVAPHSDPVYKTNIPAGGLPVHQRAWDFISTGCLITLKVSGTGADNTTKSRTVLDKHPVTSSQTTGGVLGSLPKDFMTSLKLNMRFTVLPEVSFDNGESWFPFPELKPMLLS